MASNAPIQWAQRDNSVYITIALPDVKDAAIELTGEKLTFKGTSHGKEYTADLEFFAELDSADPESKYEVKDRNIQFHIVKKEANWWPRLLKDKLKEKNQVSIDWSRYVDEDEADESFDMSQFGAGASGFGDMGGMDYGDFSKIAGMGGDMANMAGMGGMGGLGGLGGMGGMDMSQFDFSKLAGMGGLGGMGGNGDAEGDDMPDLEDEAPAAEESS